MENIWKAASISSVFQLARVFCVYEYVTKDFNNEKLTPTFTVCYFRHFS